MADVLGAVLTGGRSTRMGRDKAFIELDGTPLVLRVAKALVGSGIERVVSVGGDVEALRALGLEAVDDPRQGDGPLAGIAAALAHAGDAAIVMVLACDLAGASPAGVNRVIDALRHAAGAQVAVPVVEGKVEPLHTAWRPAVLPFLEAALDGGERAVHTILDRLSTVSVTDVDPAWFVNLNTPADLGQT
jgi:molybdopterin-guanine dinucleotide biosynthesis protein A